MAIFKTLSNLRTGSEMHETGTFFEGKIEEMGKLVEDGVLEVVKGATTVQEAMSQTEDKPEVVDETPAPQNTWGPQAGPETPVTEPALPDQTNGSGIETTQPSTGDVPPVSGETL